MTNLMFPIALLVLGLSLLIAHNWRPAGIYWPAGRLLALLPGATALYYLVQVGIGAVQNDPFPSAFRPVSQLGLAVFYIVILGYAKYLIWRENRQRAAARARGRRLREKERP